MKKTSKCLTGLLAATIAWAPIPTIAEDIDIFTGGSMSASNPSILFVLDNTANWSRQNQQWPGGASQGQAEANAIKTLLTDSSVVNTGVNLGLFEFVTEGNAGNSGGFVRYPISQMTAGNKAAFSTKLTTIYDNINAVSEKRNGNTEYGWLINDVYNYLTASAPHDSPLNPNPDAAAAGYTTPYTMFKSPITQANGCGRIFMVFIGNPSSSGPASDTAANSTALGQIPLGGGQFCSTANVSLPNFTDSVSGGNVVDLGYSLSCSTSAGCATTDFAACLATPNATYDSCACKATDFVSSLACAAGTARYMSTKTTVTTPTTNLGTSSDCRASCTDATADFAACSNGSYPGGCSCPSSVNTCPTGTQRYTVVETASAGATTVLGNTSKCKTTDAAFPGSDEAYFDFPTCLAVENQCSVIAAPTTAGACPTGAARYLMQDVATTTSTVGATDACYSSAPAASATSLAGTCSGAGVSCASPATTGTAGSCAAGTQRYMVQNSLANGATSTVGPTATCYSAAPGSVPSDMTAVCSAGTCSAPAATTTSGSCPAGTQRYMVTDSVTTLAVNLTSVTGQASVCGASTPSSATVTQPAAPPAGTVYSNFLWNRTNTNCSPNVPGSKLYEPLADRTVATNRGYSINCAANSGTAVTTGYTANGVNGTNTSTAGVTCPGATSAYNYTLTGPLLTNKGYTLACHASSGAAATTGYAANVGAGNSLTINAANTSTAALACSGGSITGSYSAYNYTKTAAVSVDKGYTLSCYTSPPSAVSGSVGYTFANTATVSATTSTGTLACNAIGPSYRASTIRNFTTATVNTTLGTTTACTATPPTTFPDYPTCGAGAGITCNATTSTNSCPSGKATYTVLGTGATISTTVDNGYTNTCTATPGAASATDVTPVPTCSGTGISCAIDGARSTTTAASGSCGGTNKRFMVQGTTPSITSSVPTGTYSAADNMLMADEWARCLHQGDLSPDGAAAVAEAFEADFNTSGVIVGADSIAFDGVTVTLAGGETPDQIAAKVADGAYTNWVATKSAAGIVTFSRTTTGVYADVTAGDFVINNVGSEATQPVVVVTTTTQGAAATGGALGKQNVTTYTIDVYNAQQNSTHTALMMSMAQQGGGRYFAAKSEAQILTALKQIMSEIQSVNTAFAAASIPLSTTNRSQNLNEVFIGVFRPSLEPRWFGNLKKFKIAKINGVLDLVDSIGTTALNSQTGFLNDCAVSFWTTDSGAWWDQVKIGTTSLASNTLINPTPRSSCVAMPAGNTSPWSDLPDGQSVEKGAVAEVIRRGNNPPTTTTTPTWAIDSNRTIYTRSGSSLTPLTQALAGGSADLYNYIRGVDINVNGSHVAEKTLATAIANAVRPSVHGDVVHSRPLAVNYGTNDTVIYYGANDGMWRAVDGATGKEKWAFIPAEFLDVTKQTRLMGDTPYVAFGAAPTVGSTPKDYMFDGSAGLFQSLNNIKVWLFPTQRRGGRMVHALDVTNSSVPALKWYHGCSSLDDTTCTAGFSGIGQTWSVPVVTKIKGYSTTRPVVVFGGGYDACEDVKPAANTSAAIAATWMNASVTGACENTKGRAVYVMDAEDGTLLKTFTITGMRGVTAGVSFVDIDNDGFADYGYVADLGGTIYRLSFVNSPVVTTPLAAADWAIKKVAYTNGRRKFMFSPAVTYGGKTTVSGTDIYSVYVALGSGDRERPLAEDYPFLSDHIDSTGATTTRNQIYGYRDTLESYAGVATAEKFTADFSTSGTIDGADVITFDGVATTLVGSETPAQIAAAVATPTYPTWTAANTGGSALVTFTRKTTGEQADITPAAFAILDAVFTTAANKPIVTISKLIDGAAAGLSACNLDGDASAVDACVLDYTTARSTCTSPGILPTESRKAWRVGFVYSGEQAVTQTVILGGMAVVNTTRPVPAGVCSAALGEGGGYFVNLINGSGAIGVDGSCGGELRGSFRGVGLPTDPVIVNLPGEDPILIGAVDKSNTNTSLPSKLFQPTPVPPPISKVKSKKYRYTVID